MDIHNLVEGSGEWFSAAFFADVLWMFYEECKVSYENIGYVIVIQ